ncbi:SMP-30/gluconolactonase/LRE family protein [Leifsonia kafniensis]|uniref:SMP-30/gluconolactonase/LRE family protein n=1 Tax=Leifsonia kafniensis TaxID=475957 RepID=A0ABP7KRW6_9MICO
MPTSTEAPGRHGRTIRHIVATAVHERLVGTDTPGGITPIPEGPAFDRDGKVFFISAFPDADGYKVFRWDPQTNAIERIIADDSIALASLVLHRDGRIFLADFRGGSHGGGRIAVANADGSNLRTFIGEFEGTAIIPDDLIFAADGTMYYNDFQGTALNPTGRVIRVDPDGSQSLLIGGVAMPNGIGLSVKQDRLWISEHVTNRLLGIQLDGRAVPDTRVYGYFTGGLLDSITIDSADNVYQAVYDGARVEVLDGEANPLAVITPGENPLRDYPRTTHVAIQPGGTLGVLLAGGPTGIGLFTFEALAPGLIPFSHQ